MKNYLVVYYSKTGNSAFLAKKLCRALQADVKEIVPTPNGLFLLVLLSLLKVKVGVSLSKKEIASYDEIILFGPIWTAQLISPLRSIIAKCAQENRPVHLGLSCTTTDEEKDHKYGYTKVFKEAKKIGGKWMVNTQAFPNQLTQVTDASQPPGPPEKVRLTEQNFKGPLQLRLEDFAKSIETRTGQEVPSL